jgi:transcriptional regulator with XRE-family HTH domain
MMGLWLLENELRDVYEDIEQLKFSELLLRCRDKLGLKQYRAGEFAKMSQQRLKNLETGYFRDMPTQDEIKCLASLYDLPYASLVVKAQEHVHEMARNRKIRIIHEDKNM